MKRRLMKKIMKFRPEILYGEKDMKSYWGMKWLEYDNFDNKDYRLVKAMTIFNKK